jgi:hypothetical protein
MEEDTFGFSNFRKARNFAHKMARLGKKTLGIVNNRTGQYYML